MESIKKNRVLRVNKTYYDDYDFVIVAENSITFGGNLSDSLGLSHEDVGDYTFGDEDFDRELKSAIKDYFNISASANLRGLNITDNDIEIIPWFFDDDDDDLDDNNVLEFLQENELAIREFADNYAKENEILVTGDYIEYWNGQNNITIELSTSIDNGWEDYEYQLLDEDDKDAVKILKEYKNADFIEENLYGITYKSEHYEFYIKKRDTFEIANVTKLRNK